MSYVIVGWSAVGASLAGYALWLARRGRSLASRVPPEQRRWSDS